MFIFWFALVLIILLVVVNILGKIVNKKEPVEFDRDVSQELIKEYVKI